MSQPVDIEQLHGGSPPTATTRRDQAKFLTHEVKTSVRDLLHHRSRPSTDSNDEIFQDAAFDPQKVLNPEKEAKASFGNRLSANAKLLANFAKNPKAVSRNNYTRHAASKIANHPQDLSNHHDEELLDAHDALIKLEEHELLHPPAASDPKSLDGKSEMESAQDRVQRIEEVREDLKSGWLLGRHIVRAKVVRPMASKPSREQFLERPKTQGQPQTLNRQRYIGHLALWYTDSYTAHRIDDFEEPPFDLSELALAFERLAAVSTPWQSFFTKVRGIYCWEDPTRTSQIMLCYWILWYFRQISTFGVGFIIYITVRNKYHPSTVQAIRERLDRSKEKTEQVRAWGELIQKYGPNDWLEPLLDGIGPLLQMQMSDLAMFLERLQNFYRWEMPQQTWYTLCLFSLSFVFLLFSSTDLCIRGLWFGMGCYFFYSFPIATNYPKYRHVVSPWCWMLFGIPNAAELAIGRLQEKVTERDDIRIAELGRKGSQLVNQAPLIPEFDPELSNAGVKPNSAVSSSKTLPAAGPKLLEQVRASDTLTFKTVLLPSHLQSRITLTRTHIIFEPENQEPLSHSLSSLLEIRKIDLDKDADVSTSKANKSNLSRSTHIAKWLEKGADIQLIPDALAFAFLNEEHGATGVDPRVGYSNKHHRATTIGPLTEHEAAFDNTHVAQRKIKGGSGGPNSNDPGATTATSKDKDQRNQTQVTIILNKSDRDKIFAVVLAWSGLRWQPLCHRNRQHKLGTRRTWEDNDDVNLNSNLDDEIKRGLS